jgi:hypothetical protein
MGLPRGWNFHFVHSKMIVKTMADKGGGGYNLTCSPNHDIGPDVRHYEVTD